MLRVLCVCTGNTCRSPMLEGLLKAEAGRQSLPVLTESAGLAAFPGDPVSTHAERVMREAGIDISAHRARALTTYLLDESDCVICMNERQKEALCAFVPEEKLFVPPGGIPDPFGKDENAYRQCRDALKAYADAFLRKVSAPVIAALTAQTVEAVAGIERVCFSTPWSADAIREELENEQAFVFTAAVCGEIAGYIGVHLVLDEAYLSNVAVLPQFRSRGVGTALLQTVTELCRSRGCAFLTLEVRESNEEAIRLYQKLGFTVRGKRKAFYEKPPEDGCILTLDFEKDRSKDEPKCES